MSQKTYINGPLINEYTFKDGGSILKFNIAADKIDDFALQLKSAARDGWSRLVIQQNRNPVLSKKTGKVVATHSMSVDTWQPTQGQSAPQRPAPQRPAPDRSVPDDVPF